MKGHILFAGDKFGNFTVMAEGPRAKSGDRQYLCICVCGKERVLTASILVHEERKSCGCKSLKHTTHGAKRGGKATPTYHSWLSMKSRCLNPNDPYFYRYGGRGIKICDRWLHCFENFLADMGERPKGKTLDRINGNKDYEPGNCRWATIKEQNRNHPRVKLSLEKAARLRELRSQGVQAKEIAALYGIRTPYVYSVQHSNLWT